MTYSETRIVTSNDLKKRSYVVFYFNGKRIREFNGKSIGLKLQPNLATSVEERNKLLRQLEYELVKALKNDNYPIAEANETICLKETKSSKAVCVLRDALDRKLSSDLNGRYKKNLEKVHNSFISFLTPKELNGDIDNIKSARVQEFLSQFNSSGTYYMNKRRDLGVLFSSISKSLGMKLQSVLETDSMRSKAKLHRIYDKEQIKPILEFLKMHYPNLHLCCLLSYGCFLRPHQEVRNLQSYHFKKNCTEIHLSGNENKGGRVRIIYIPDYVRNELKKRLSTLRETENIFTKSTEPFNDDYFKTAWTRAWNKMFKLGLIQKNQTIYSFRHTAAVNVYHKTKDIHILQQLLGHSDMIVTLKYLRGLGEVNMRQLKDALPEL